ncbi:peptidoglycan DD-metalloendopeptidase family protein [Patescibacteria group bacterium]|nr:peptidoglycan DD-metalloendopeptidase family protein [Patescibacteria group bacterium]
MIYPIKEWESTKRGYKFGEPTFYSAHHLGVDHIVPIGTSVYAPVDCEVTQSFNGVEGGNQVHVSFNDSDYGTLIMRCMHLRELAPKGKFKEGKVIGYTGNTGKYTKGPHLHTDISKGAVKLKEFGNFIDPEKYFSDRIKNVANHMVTYKKNGEPAIYVLVGDILIPFATSFEVYQKEFGNAKLVTLSSIEFSKYKVSQTVQISPKNNK